MLGEKGNKMPNKRKYISTEYGLVNLRDGDWVIHLDPEVLAELYWEVQDGKLVRVIRCKDCKYYDAHWCTYWEDMGMEHTDFCSKAERKEDE